MYEIDRSRMPALRAIDVYSGVGGWSLGLGLAGIEVVASYEWSPAANKTNLANNGHPTHTVNVRTMDLHSLPDKIDIVVGSPPCTQFSYSNRGGGGDLADGLKDIFRFFEIVEACKPAFWAMENVPRVQNIMKQEFAEGGTLQRFAHLSPHFKTISTDTLGLPQRRKRCIVSNITLDNLDVEPQVAPTLGDVVAAIGASEIVDPLYGLRASRETISDIQHEEMLTEEEVRINRSAKVCHPIYNYMTFPDPLDKTPRTVTATCTRVSRESIVIHDKVKGGFRRLSLREKACLQGFPVSFQFLGDSHGAKEGMIGNAMPPPVAYRIAHVMLNTDPKKVPALSELVGNLRRVTEVAPPTVPNVKTQKYLHNRRFQFAIPSMHLKSGVRFELVNDTSEQQTKWSVDFVFGSSKQIFRTRPNADLVAGLLTASAYHRMTPLFAKLDKYLRSADIERMQAVWSHRGPGGTRPFHLLDELSSVADEIASCIPAHEGNALGLEITARLEAQFPARNMVGVEKLRKNASRVVAGCLTASLFNAVASSDQVVAKAVLAHSG